MAWVGLGWYVFNGMNVCVCMHMCMYGMVWVECHRVSILGMVSHHGHDLYAMSGHHGPAAGWWRAGWW